MVQLDMSERQQAVDELGMTIASWSLSSTRALIAELFEVLFDKGLTPEQDYKLHLEMLTFFLLNFERYCLDFGGEKLRDSLHNETSDLAIRITLSKITREGRVCVEKDVIEALEYYNDAASDYDKCPVLVDTLPDYQGSRTVLGRLSVRVLALLGQPVMAHTADLVSALATEALAESALRSGVKEASDSLL